MRPKVTLEQHLKDCWHRATFALGYLDARSPESTQIDFVQGRGRFDAGPCPPF